MTIRSLQPSDIPKLRAMQGEFPYPDTVEGLESIRVAVDANGEPVAAIGAKKLVELYFWCGEFHNPMAKMLALRCLADDLGVELVKLGYKSVEAFLPPSIAKVFGHRLEKSFGFVKNWQSWTKGI